MLTGPIEATRHLLSRNNLSIEDIDLTEINEAFASVAFAWLRELGGDPATTNPNGGAIALGHPLGATGTFLATKALAELERERSHLRALFDTMPDLVWLKDPDCVYLSCTKRFEPFFGAAEASIQGKTDFDFVDAELAKFFRANDLAALLANGPCKNDEWVTFASDGHRELLETTKAPIHDSKGNLIGVLGIGRDMTRNHELQERFAVAFNASPAAISLTRLSAMAEIESVAAEAASDLVAKLSGVKIGAADAKAAVKAVLHG